MNNEDSSTQSDYVSTEPWEAFALSEAVRKGIAARGYEKPTPVQAACLRPALAGRDLIVRSKTGTGKTAAFGVPILERIAGGGGVQALALCPTRELALQVATEIGDLGAPKGLRTVAIYGGASMEAQISSLRGGAEVAVGTPGRVQDLIDRGRLKLDRIAVAVLDEADEMLSMGFYEDVTRILSMLPAARQTMLFSATVAPDIEEIIRKFLREPEVILLSGDVYTVEGIRHVLYHASDQYPKPRNLLYLIEMEDPESAIVFCNTRDDTGLVTAVLSRNGLDAEVLNGDLPQKERERVMAKVKRGELRFMVATDLAARGIDISDLTHVINYSLPEDPAVYLHRVGRTGRIGKTGTALSLVEGKSIFGLGQLEKRFGIQFEVKEMPSAEEAQRMWSERHLRELHKAMTATAFEAYLPLARELRARGDGELLTAFALKSFFDQHRRERLAAAAKVEAPPPAAAPAASEEGGRRRRRGRGVGPPAPAHGGADAITGTATPALGVRVFVALGSQDGLDGAGVAQAVAELTGVGADAFSVAEVRRSHSFLKAAAEAADKLVAASGRARGDKSVLIERARKRR
jgi:ATP-dependent RNA helicase DeaD